VSVIKMIEGEQTCVYLAQKLHAVEKAVQQAKRTLIPNHIDHWLDSALAGFDDTPVAVEFTALSKYL
jgi:DNA-binding FrmR family transcriptional regulator